MLSSISFISFLRSAISIPVSFCSLVSRIAFACKSSKENCFFSFSLASLTSLDDLINLIVKSIASSALISASRMCSLSLAFFRKNSVLLLTTSSLWFRYSRIISLIPRVLGTLLTRTRLMIPYEICAWVCSYIWLRVTSGLKSFLTLITILIPSLLLSSLMFEIP